MSQKIHETDADKHAAYRERRSAKLKAVAKIAEMIRGNAPFDPVEGGGWYQVEIEVNRAEENKAENVEPATLRYVFAEEHLLRLQAGINAYKDDPERAPWHGTFAFADTAGEHLMMSGIPGMLTLTFDDIEIVSTKKIKDKDYAPPGSYNISNMAVRLFLEKSPPQPKRSRSLVEELL